MDKIKYEKSQKVIVNVVALLFVSQLKTQNYLDFGVDVLECKM